MFAQRVHELNEPIIRISQKTGRRTDRQGTLIAELQEIEFLRFWRCRNCRNCNFSHIGSDLKWLCFLEPWALKTNWVCHSIHIFVGCQSFIFEDKCRKFRRFLWRFPHFQKNRFMRCLDQLKLHIHNLKSITIHLVN